MMHVEMVTPAGRVYVKVGEVDAHLRRGCTFAHSEARDAYNAHAVEAGWLQMGPETVYGANAPAPVAAEPTDAGDVDTDD